jgi:hypothetical protein
MRAVATGLVCAVFSSCSKPAPPPPVEADVVAEVAAPALPPQPATEDGVLQAFTQSLELRDLAALRRVIVPELGAELTRMHDMNPQEFWNRGGVWVANAKTGMTIATRAEDAGKVARWRALVRFGNGIEETVEFATVDGVLLLAEP